jgi:hypothetical protein
VREDKSGDTRGDVPRGHQRRSGRGLSSRARRAGWRQKIALLEKFLAAGDDSPAARAQFVSAAAALVAALIAAQHGAATATPTAPELDANSDASGTSSLPRADPGPDSVVSLSTEPSSPLDPPLPLVLVVDSRTGGALSSVDEPAVVPSALELFRRARLAPYDALRALAAVLLSLLSPLLPLLTARATHITFLAVFVSSSSTAASWMITMPCNALRALINDLLSGPLSSADQLSP